MTGNLPPMISLTDAAAARVRTLLDESPDGAVGLRLSITTKGCSGLSYSMEYVTAPAERDELVEDKGVKVFIDPLATMFILGSELDYQEGPLQSGFVFNNPNEKGRCGCGESFHI